MILSINEVRQHGLRFLKLSIIDQEALGVNKCSKIFKDIYGSWPTVHADQWNDLMTTNVPNASCVDGDKTLDGFKHFLIAHCFLHGYPRNENWIRVLFFPIGEKDTRGEPLWRWVRKIQALLPTKIKFLPRWEDPDDEHCEIFIMGVDGTDCKILERQHAVFPMDKGPMSHKFKHAALKCEIGVAIHDDKIVWCKGPFKGAKHDVTIFREEGLKDKVKSLPGDKVLILDRGHRSSKPDEVNMLATPQLADNPELHQFESRVRCRTETVMGRIKNFKCTSDMFRHGNERLEEKHEWAFKAVVVTVQYQIDNGSHLYQV